MKSKARIKESGEVFTPRSLIREMLISLSNDVWFDPNKTWFEPSAGDGNFLVEIKARLIQAGHNEIQILENMLFSVELIDDNHWTLQHRLGYLIDGNPNPLLNQDHFLISKIHPMTQDLNDKNPYHEKLGLERDEVLHHRNHVCYTALEYDMSFGRTESDAAPVLELLPVRDLGEWPETDTPDIGEKYVVEKMLGKQPNIATVEAKITYVYADDVAKSLKPGDDPKFFYIYYLMHEGKIFYVGMSTDVKQRWSSHNWDKSKTKEERPSAVGTQDYLKQVLAKGGGEITIGILDTIPAPEGYERGDKVPQSILDREQEIIAECIAAGEPLVNKMKTEKSVKVPKVKVAKEPKAPKEPNGEGKGGWAVHPKNYGRGKKLRSFFKGAWWTADHDKIVDIINVSLHLSGKKTLFEDERPFSSSTGLRGGEDYWTKE